MGVAPPGSSTITNTGSDNATHTIELDLAEGVDLQRIKAVTLTVSVRGMNLNTNNLGMSGDSFIELPTLEIVE